MQIGPKIIKKFKKKRRKNYNIAQLFYFIYRYTLKNNSSQIDLRASAHESHMKPYLHAVEPIKEVS